MYINNRIVVAFSRTKSISMGNVIAFSIRTNYYSNMLPPSLWAIQTLTDEPRSARNGDRDAHCQNWIISVSIRPNSEHNRKPRKMSSVPFSILLHIDHEQLATIMFDDIVAVLYLGKYVFAFWPALHMGIDFATFEAVPRRCDDSVQQFRCRHHGSSYAIAHSTA